MKILSKNFINKFGKKIINIHPSILPKFKGLNTYKRMLKNNEIKGGCSGVHFVNEKLDSGQIILKKVFLSKAQIMKTLLNIKLKKLEYKAYSEAIIKIFSY